MDCFNEILEEIFNVKRNTKFVFDDFFLRHSVPDSEKFELYRKLMTSLSGYVELEEGYGTEGFVEIISKYKNTTVGFPYMLPHLKLK